MPSDYVPIGEIGLSASTITPGPTPTTLTATVSLSEPVDTGFIGSISLFAYEVQEIDTPAGTKSLLVPSEALQITGASGHPNFDIVFEDLIEAVFQVTFPAVTGPAPSVSLMLIARRMKHLNSKQPALPSRVPATATLNIL